MIKRDEIYLASFPFGDSAGMKLRGRLWARRKQPRDSGRAGRIFWQRHHAGPAYR